MDEQSRQSEETAPPDKTAIPEQNSRGWVLLATQAVLFVLVLVAALTPPVGPTLWSSLWLALAVVVLGSVGVVVSGKSLGRALTPLPLPNGEGLAAAGLYRWVRHPMYSSLVIIALGVAMGTGKAQSYVAAAALAGFFAVKARVEEKYLLTAYAGYAEYGASIGRFVPGVGRLRRMGSSPGST